MIAQPPHNRKLGLLGASLTKARLNPHSIKVLSSIRDELEPILIESGFLLDTPFSWITVSVRFGLKNDNEP
jgi:hypothetical protein